METYEKLKIRSDVLIDKVQMEMIRHVPIKLNFEWRLNGILGARGTGKTTKMLQKLKELKLAGNKVLYVTLDDYYFATNNLMELAQEFEAKGGKYLFLDEVHKMPNWAIFLKNIYDLELDLKIVFSGSSILQMGQSSADLSRRALMYEMPELSFREYLLLKHGIEAPVLKLDDIVKNHSDIVSDLTKSFRPLTYFLDYLKNGNYPFLMEKGRDYQLSLTQIVKYVLEVDFNTISGYQGGQYYKLMDILLTIAQNPPFDFNATRIAQSIGLNRNTLLNYLHYLQKAGLLFHVNYRQSSVSNFKKPDKMLLRNPNLYYNMLSSTEMIGSMRESFFVNQLGYENDVFLTKGADFQVGEYIFELGGKNKKKTKHQKQLKNLLTVKDDIERGLESSIPLYLFGLLY